MLVQHGFKRVDNPVLLPGGRSDLVKTDADFHLLSVLLHQLHDGTIAKVGFNETSASFVFTASTQDLPEGVVRVSFLCRKDVANEYVTVYLTKDNGDCFVFTATRRIDRTNGLLPPFVLTDSFRLMPSVTRKSNRRQIESCINVRTPNKVRRSFV